MGHYGPVEPAVVHMAEDKAEVDMGAQGMGSRTYLEVAGHLEGNPEAVGENIHSLAVGQDNTAQRWVMVAGRGQSHSHKVSRTVSW